MKEGRELRAWQIEAMDKWRASGERGIASVVTGGGKTIFALACAESSLQETIVVAVPTAALAAQWLVEISEYFGLPISEIRRPTVRSGFQAGGFNVVVMNTAAELVARGESISCMLIVDECHKAASPKLRRLLELATGACIGLSATPERQYDDGLRTILVPALGDVIVNYGYAEALRDGVIVPFSLHNVVFDLEPERQYEYDRLSRSMIFATSNYGSDSEEVIALLLRRARVSNLSENRVRLALRIAVAHKSKKTIIFHEDVDACDVLNKALIELGIQSSVYHSRLTFRERLASLMAFRGGVTTCLVTCRALDEGFNVPSAELAIIAASTATVRQRIQRLGRVLRPSKSKASAKIFSLVATKSEINRLQKEAEAMAQIASTTWSRA